MDIKTLEKLPIGYVDTPLEYLENLTKKIGKSKIYVKRDDMTGLALGGNKARKLNYLVKDAVDKGYTALLTFGGVQTNHGRMTVGAAVKYGLKPILLLGGKKPDYCSGNLILDTMMGTDVYFYDTSVFNDLPAAEKAEKTAEFLKKCTDEIIQKYEKQGDKVYSIPVGGQGVIGSAGYIEAVPEIMKQMKEQNINAKYLVAGYGSTGTFAGLVAGALHYKAPFKVIGIPVSPTYRPVENTVDFVNELSKTYDLGFTATAEDICIENGPADAPYSGEAYNKPDSTTREYIELLASTEAIFADPCYTGKVFRGTVEMIKSGKIEPDAGVIFLHTGGSPAIWAKEHLDDMQDQFYNNYDKLTQFTAK